MDYWHNIRSYCHKKHLCVLSIFMTVLWFYHGFLLYYAQPTKKVRYKHQWVTQMPHQKESFCWKPHIYNLHGSVNQYFAFLHHLIPLTNNILDKLYRAPVKQIISPKAKKKKQFVQTHGMTPTFGSTVTSNSHSLRTDLQTNNFMKRNRVPRASDLLTMEASGMSNER